MTTRTNRLPLRRSIIIKQEPWSSTDVFREVQTKSRRKATRRVVFCHDAAGANEISKDILLVESERSIHS